MLNALLAINTISVKVLSMYVSVSSVKGVLYLLVDAVVLTQRVSTVHFCKSISDQSLLVWVTHALLSFLYMVLWAGMGGTVSGGGEREGVLSKQVDE